MDVVENGQAIDPALTQATEAEPQTAPQTEGTEPSSDVETPAEKTFTQAELDAILEKKTAKLIRQREQERATRKAYEQQMARVPAPQATEGKPQLAQFSDPEQYAEAVSNWKLEQITHQQHAAQVQQSQGEFQAKRDDLMADLEDAEGFDQRKFDKLPISRTMAEAIVDSDQGVKLTVHLVNHPEEAARIAALPPARQAAELGKLEAKLSSAPVKKPSNAPAPITPVGAKGSSVSSDIYDKTLVNDTAAWIAARNKALKGR